MKRSRQTALLTGVFCGAAAVIWTVLAVLHVVLGVSPPWLIALHFLCVLVWWVAFAAQAVRYRHIVKEQEGQDRQK